MGTFNELLAEVKVNLKVKKDKTPSRPTVPLTPEAVKSIVKYVQDNVKMYSGNEAFGDDLIDVMGDAGNKDTREFVRAFRNQYNVKTSAVKVKDFTDAITKFASTYKA